MSKAGTSDGKGAGASGEAEPRVGEGPTNRCWDPLGMLSPCREWICWTSLSSVKDFFFLQ